MPRTPLTPVQAQAKVNADAAIATDAVETVCAILSGTWSGPDAAREGTLAGAAATLEAFGCYVRKTNAKGLLVP